MASISASSAATINQDTYLQLLVAQIQNQNPLEPVSDTEFIGQLTSFNQLSSLQSLNTNFSEMLKFQQLGQGANLIGKSVEYTDGNGTAQTGTVNRVVSNGSTIKIEIGNVQVGLDQITSVS